MNNPEPKTTSWTLHTGGATVQLLLSEVEIIAGQIPGGNIAGFGVVVNAVPQDAPIADEFAQSGGALVVEVVAGSAASLDRLDRFRARHPGVLVVAAMRDPSLPEVKALLKSGISDVVGLPLKVDELATVLDQLWIEMQRQRPLELRLGKIVSVVPSVGGVGATTLATQAASLHARRDSAHGRTTCLIDLDLQFGNAGTYLGVRPRLTLQDLLDAGSRVDGELLRSACIQTTSGLHVIPAPADILPLESVSSDQILNIIELATNEFDTVYLDLPGNWTNWSLSLMARSSAVLLVIETTVASLRQARRQLALLQTQGLNTVPVQIVMNRVEKKLFRSISLEDAERVLGHSVAFSIANDFNLVSTALDQGTLINDVKSGSKVAKDIMGIVEGCELLFDRGDG